MDVLLQNKWIWVCIALLILEEAIHAKQNTIKAGVCPRCGGQLVERNGRYGKFMGCSNYPKCRYVQKM